MSYQPQPKGRSENEITETLLNGIEFLAKALMWLGLVSSVVSLGFLVYYVVMFSSGSTADAKTATDLIELFRKVLTGGLLAFFLGTAYLFWGEGWMEIVQILSSLACYAAPIYFPLILPAAGSNPVALLATVG